MAASKHGQTTSQNLYGVGKMGASGRIHSIKSIHRQTGVHRQTIKKYLKYEEYPQKINGGTKMSKALPFEDYLRKRWDEGETRYMQLWREIKEQGFTGSPQSVYRFICKYPRDRSIEKLPPPLKVKVWSARKVSSLMSKPFEDLDEETQNYLGRPQKVGADFRLLSYQSGDVRRLSKQQSLPLLSL